MFDLIQILRTSLLDSNNRSVYFSAPPSSNLYLIHENRIIFLLGGYPLLIHIFSKYTFSRSSDMSADEAFSMSKLLFKHAFLILGSDTLNPAWRICLPILFRELSDDKLIFLYYEKPFKKSIYSGMANLIVHIRAVLLYLSRSLIYKRAISGTKGSSGLGSHKREHIDNNTFDTVKAGLH